MATQIPATPEEVINAVNTILQGILEIGVQVSELLSGVVVETLTFGTSNPIHRGGFAAERFSGILTTVVVHAACITA